MTWRRRVARLVQLATGVHRIHHIRWSYGWRLPFVGWAYFPPFVARDYMKTWDGASEVVRVAYGWRRVKPSEFHDCTRTGRY